MDPESTLEQLRSLSRAAIDSSSVIYAAKSGLLDTLCTALELRTVPGVVNEVGYPLPLIRLEEKPEGGSVDNQILACAAGARIPLISEDRKLLVKADEVGLECYNLLVVLELLLLRGHLSLVDWDCARKRLLASAQYSARVVHAGQLLHWTVRKEIG